MKCNSNMQCVHVVQYFWHAHSTFQLKFLKIVLLHWHHYEPFAYFVLYTYGPSHHAHMGQITCTMHIWDAYMHMRPHMHTGAPYVYGQPICI